MAKKFGELRARMSPGCQARSKALHERMVAEMPLHELRHAEALSQEALAKRLQVDQAAVSKTEYRSDMYVSSLRDCIRAMGREI